MAQDQEENRKRLQAERRDLKKQQSGPKACKAMNGPKLGPIVIEDVIKEVYTLKGMLGPRIAEFSKNSQLHEQCDRILKILQHNPLDTEPVS